MFQRGFDILNSTKPKSIGKLFVLEILKQDIGQHQPGGALSILALATSPRWPHWRQRRVRLLGLFRTAVDDSTPQFATVLYLLDKDIAVRVWSS